MSVRVETAWGGRSTTGIVGKEVVGAAGASPVVDVGLTVAIDPEGVRETALDAPRPHPASPMTRASAATVTCTQVHLAHFMSNIVSDSVRRTPA